MKLTDLLNDKETMQEAFATLKEKGLKLEPMFISVISRGFEITLSKKTMRC